MLILDNDCPCAIAKTINEHNRKLEHIMNVELVIKQLDPQKLCNLRCFKHYARLINYVIKFDVKNLSLEGKPDVDDIKYLIDNGTNITKLKALSAFTDDQLIVISRSLPNLRSFQVWNKWQLDRINILR